MTAKYKKDQRVWLATFEDQPREKATVLSVKKYKWGIGYVVNIAPHEKGDDGIREVSEDQIEGPV